MKNQIELRILGLLRMLHRTRMLPGFMHFHWQRCFDERDVVSIFEQVSPLSLGQALGARRLPFDWVVE